MSVNSFINSLLTIKSAVSTKSPHIQAIVGAAPLEENPDPNPFNDRSEL
jgi:hypothetical protein